MIHYHITTADLTQKRNKINQRFAPEATRLHDHITSADLEPKICKSTLNLASKKYQKLDPKTKLELA
jgi:hypothetical protein